MAFGFLKKIVDILTGGGKKKRGKGDKSKNGRGKNNRSGRGREQGARTQEQKVGRNGKNQPQQRQQKGAQQQRGGQNGSGGAKPSHQRGERRDRRDRDQSRNSRRSPAAVNTKAGEMRPGGEIPAAELAARKAAHAAWSLEQFTVEPLEGKKRFQFSKR